MKELLVYVIDDDRDVLATVGQLIGDAEARVQLLSSSTGFRPTASELARSLFIIDLKMHPETGFELIERLQTVDPGFAYLVHSATTTVTAATQLMKSRALGIIEKPAEPASLYEAVVSGLSYVAKRADMISNHAELFAAFDLLSPREQEVMFFLSMSSDSEMVSERLGCAKRTVESHRLMVNQKLGRPAAKRLIAALSNYLVHRQHFHLPDLGTLDVDSLLKDAARTAPASLFGS